LSPVIKTANLTKRYGSIYAVRNVNLHIERGEIYGFVGLNGAGKTTLMRLLLGMVRPSSGQAYVQGVHVGRRSYEIWRHVGYVIETATAYPELTVEENIKIACQLRLVPENRGLELLEMLSLTMYRKKRANDLSLGNKQRLALVKALLHRPSILLLDEPVNGLDPAGIIEMRTLLRQLAEEEKTTIVLSSHLLDEMSQLAHRIGFIHAGTIITEKNAAQLENALQRRLVIETKDAIKAKKSLQPLGVAANVQDKQSLFITDKEAIHYRERIAHQLVHHNVAIRYFAVERERLEDYFLRIIQVKE